MKRYLIALSATIFFILAAAPLASADDYPNVSAVWPKVRIVDGKPEVVANDSITVTYPDMGSMKVGEAIANRLYKEIILKKPGQSAKNNLARTALITSKIDEIDIRADGDHPVEYGTYTHKSPVYGEQKIQRLIVHVRVSKDAKDFHRGDLVLNSIEGLSAKPRVSEALRMVDLLGVPQSKDAKLNQSGSPHVDDQKAKKGPSAEQLKAESDQESADALKMAQDFLQQDDAPKAAPQTQIAQEPAKQLPPVATPVAVSPPATVAKPKAPDAPSIPAVSILPGN